MIERHLRRRTHHDDGTRGIELQPLKDRMVGLEVRQVVLLLQPLIRVHLALCSVAIQSLGRDRGGHHHCARQTAVDVVLHRGPLVVEHGRTRYAQDRGRHGHVVGTVAEGDVKAPATGRSGLGPRPAHERGRTRGQAGGLG
jgi:hypothetical protein